MNQIFTFKTRDLLGVVDVERVIDKINLARLFDRQRGVGIRQRPVLRIGFSKAVFPWNTVADQGRLRRKRDHSDGIAGLNFEHIHDGTTKGLKEKFEPRKFPMELRVISDTVVELYQPPTKNWKLESCGRYELLDDGTIEYTFECIPRANGYTKGFIGLFWASYIHQPEDKAVFFVGRKNKGEEAKWIKGVTPKHGVKSTHRPKGISKLPPVESDFPLTLVNHPSELECSESWYYGVCRGMAIVQMFQPQDNVWIAQSPSGGGNGNPAWDFQWFIQEPKVNHVYRLVMRMSYFEFKDRENVLRRTAVHRNALRSAAKEK